MEFKDVFSKRITLICILVVSILGLFLGIYRPLRERDMLLERLISVKQDDYYEMNEIINEYRIMTENLRDSHFDRTNSVPLLSLLEEISQNSGIRANLDLMAPGPEFEEGGIKYESVEASFRGMSISQCIAFLYSLKLSTSENQIRNMKLRRNYQSPHLLDLSIRVVAPETDGL